MLDVFGLPSERNCDIQVFTRPCTALHFQYETWRRPRGCSMSTMLAIGGGGGGGGGHSAAAGNARGGGGAGGSSGISRLTIPIFLLPEILYVQVGAGGTGGAATVNGNNGVSSWIGISTQNSTVNRVLVSGDTQASGGVAGTGAAAGTGGNAGTIGSIGNCVFAGLGNFNFIAGQAGAAGGSQAGANGTAITIPTSSCVCQGGSGGGGTTSADFAGGAFTAVAGAFISDFRPSTPAAGSNSGSGGPQLWRPFFSFGGGGGSSSNTGVGGHGGKGAYGAGGGGGGGGTTGGTGGDGGQGIVIIISW